MCTNRHRFWKECMEIAGFLWQYYIVYHKTMNVIFNAWYLILVGSICIQMSLQRKLFICLNVHRQQSKNKLLLQKHRRTLINITIWKHPFILVIFRSSLFLYMQCWLFSVRLQSISNSTMELLFGFKQTKKWIGSFDILSIW